MKTIFFSFLLLFGLHGYSQDAPCHAIVQHTIEAINQGNSAPLEGDLAADFVIAGQQGEIAKMVLDQLLAQLGETVVKYEAKSQSENEGELTLIYTIEYQNMGAKEGRFVFDHQQKLKELELFAMKVKSMHKHPEVQQSDQNTISIPFRMAGNLIAVPVQINGQEKMFLLDSGAPVVVLNSNHLPKSEEGSRTLTNTQGVNGEIQGMDIHEIESLDFGGLRLKDEELLSMNLAHLEEGLDFEIHGLVGYELIKDYDLLFDYARKQLTLIRPDHLEQFQKTTWAKKTIDQVPFELQGHIPVFEGQIAGETYTFGLDCGAESNLMDDDLYQVLQPQLRRESKDDLLGADNNPVSVCTGLIKRLSLGKTTWKNTSTLFNDMTHLNEGYRLALDGLLGYPILSGQQTLLSFSRGELWFID